MASGQGRGGHGRDANKCMNRNMQRRRAIIMSDDSSLTNMRLMRTIEVTIKIFLDKNLDTNINMNQIHIDLQFLRVATTLENQNAVTCHQRENQQKQV